MQPTPVVPTTRPGSCPKCGSTATLYDVIGEWRCGRCWGGVHLTEWRQHRPPHVLAEEMEHLAPAASHSWVVRNWDDILHALKTTR